MLLSWNISKEQSSFIKGIAIIEVIFGHCGLVECGGAIGVDLFLLISGYGIYLSYTKTDGNRYWIKRVESVYFPYLFCTLCFIVYRIIIGNNMTWPQIIVSLLGLDFDLNLDPTMWYISYVFVMYIFAWGYIELSKTKRFIGFFMVWGIVLFVTTCGYKYLIWHKGTIAWAYGLTFPLGLLLAEHKRSINSLIPYLTIGLIISSLFLIQVPHETYMKMITIKKSYRSPSHN